MQTVPALPTIGSTITIKGTAYTVVTAEHVGPFTLAASDGRVVANVGVRKPRGSKHWLTYLLADGSYDIVTALR